MALGLAAHCEAEPTLNLRTVYQLLQHLSPNGERADQRRASRPDAGADRDSQDAAFGSSDGDGADMRFQ